MRTKLKVVLGLTTVVLLSLSIGVAEEEKFKATCPVSGKPAIETSSVEYKDGLIYLCCDKCPKAFEANTAKFAAKANAQLVETGQYKQKACPLTGRKPNSSQNVSIAGASVDLCCGGCKAKVNKAEGAAKVNLAFSEAAFKKGFEIAKKAKDKE